jgi:threonine/homoserine/homoserine lactone efflux protein
VPDPSRLALFAVAALALVAVPGPSVFYVVAQSVSHGRAAGIASSAGVALGALGHVAAATAGLSALLVASAEGFAAVKYAGAAYLVWLGVRRLAGRDADAGTATGASGRARLVRQGALVEALNPKTALFFLAFLPQFVDPARGAAAPQLAVLGAILVVVGLATDTLWALASGTLGARLRSSPRFRRGERLASGSILVGLGVATALSGSRQRA